MHNNTIFPSFSNNYLNDVYLEQLELEAAQKESLREMHEAEQKNLLPGVSEEEVLAQSQLERALEESKVQGAFEKAVRTSITEAEQTDTRNLRKGVEKSTVDLAKQVSVVDHNEHQFKKAVRKNELETAKAASIVDKENQDIREAEDMSAIEHLAKTFAWNEKVKAIRETVSHILDMEKIVKSATDLIKALIAQPSIPVRELPAPAPVVLPPPPVVAPAPLPVDDVLDIEPFPEEPALPLIVAQPIAEASAPVIHAEPEPVTSNKISKAAPKWLRDVGKETKPYYGEKGSGAIRTVKDATVRSYFSTLRGTLDRSKGHASLKNGSERYMTVAHGMHRHLKVNKTIYGEPITEVMVDKLAKLPLKQLVWLYLVTEHEADTYGRDEHWNLLSNYMKYQIFKNYHDKNGNDQNELIKYLDQLDLKEIADYIK